MDLFSPSLFFSVYAAGSPLLSQISRLDILVGRQLLAGSRHGDQSRLHDIAPVGGMERHVGVLLDEQNGNMALQTADFGYVLETGRISLSGSGSALLTNEAVKKAYLGE